jgi:origin recognition complex subunit 2
MSKESPKISMAEWFATATPEKCDAMSALQLDYRFSGDHLGSVWWLQLQELDFKHNGTKRTYELPKSAPSSRQKEYTGNELYEIVDRFAIPQRSSPLEDFPPKPSASMTKDEEDWWRQLRDELIFLKFRKEVERIPVVERNENSSKAKPTSSKNRETSKRKKPTSIDAGAELFMRKKKKGRPKKIVIEEDVMHLEVVFPTIKEYAEMAQSVNLAEVEKLEESYTSSFEDWRFLSTMNHSLLFYGVGSKRELLNRFASDELEKDGDVLVIDGFDKDVTIEGLLELIIDNWLGGERPSYNRYDVHVGRNGMRGMHTYPHRGDPSTVQRAIAIANALAGVVPVTLRPLYLVIHNIDGVALRNATAQEALAGLVSHSTTPRGFSSLRLMASVDHVNGPALLWDSLTCSRFRWIWKQVHTHRPYVKEVTESKISDLPKTLQRKRVLELELENTTEKSVFSVLTSLAPRHTEALQQLASLQLAQAAKGAEWVDYKDLYQRIHKQLIVSTDHQLRYFLKELGDHGIIERSADASVPSYRIPYSEDKLKQILNFEIKR